MKVSIHVYVHGSVRVFKTLRTPVLIQVIASELIKNNAIVI